MPRCPKGKRWNGHECVPKAGWSDYGYQEKNEARLEKLAGEYWSMTYKRHKKQPRKNRDEEEFMEQEEFIKFTTKHKLKKPMKMELAGYLVDNYNIHSLENYSIEGTIY